jgi:hypothetical protein
VSVRHEARHAGRSNYTFGRLLTHAANMLTGFSVVPLRISSFVGFLLTLFGAGALAFVLGRYLIVGVTVPGFSFLASVIIIFSGTQLFALGVIGEYLARMHFRLLGQPTYAIRPDDDQMSAGHADADNLRIAHRERDIARLVGVERGEHEPHV